MRFIQRISFQIFLFLILAALIIIIHKVKHIAQIEKDSLKKLRSEVKIVRNQIELLKIDWQFLTQPERLSKIAEKYKDKLKLNPIDPKKVVDLQDITLKNKQVIQKSNAVSKDEIGDLLKDNKSGN